LHNAGNENLPFYRRKPKISIFGPVFPRFCKAKAVIIGYFGTVRQGKTLSAVKELYKFYLDGKTIYSNIKLNFPYKPITTDMLLNIVESDLVLDDDSCMFIDEMHIWFDSRISSSKKSRIISYFLLQTGKMGKNTDFGLILLYTTQFRHQVDKRLRSLTDISIDCEKKEFQAVYCYKFMDKEQ
jgi:hypothetical protein